MSSIDKEVVSESGDDELDDHIYLTRIRHAAYHGFWDGWSVEKSSAIWDMKMPEQAKKYLNEDGEPRLREKDWRADNGGA